MVEHGDPLVHHRSRGLRWGSGACSSPTAARSRCGSSGPASTRASRASSRCPRPTGASRAALSPTGRSCIGPAAAAESYLDVDRGWSPPRMVTGCDALHPGYGFLSERPELAGGLRGGTGSPFVGPPAEVMRRGGDKATARALAASLGIPIGDGLRRARRRDAAPRGRRRGRLPGAAQGRGRRRRPRHARWSTEPAELRRRVRGRERARPRQAFGDGRLYLERFVTPRPPRRGPGARRRATAASSTSASATARCQRRYQKLVEEAPAARLAGRARGADLLRGRGRAGPRARLRRRGHRRVPRRRRARRVVVPRDQRPHAGRAPGHRDGHRRRHRARAAADRRRASRSGCGRTTSRSPATRSRCGSTPRTRRATSRPSPRPRDPVGDAGRRRRARRHRTASRG